MACIIRALCDNMPLENRLQALANLLSSASASTQDVVVSVPGVANLTLERVRDESGIDGAIALVNLQEIGTQVWVLSNTDAGLKFADYVRQLPGIVAKPRIFFDKEGS